MSSEKGAGRPWTQAELDGLRKDYIPVLTAVLPADSRAKILDIGCGFGPSIYSLTSMGYRDITAVDVSPECCRYVEGRFPGVSVVCSDAIHFLKDDSRIYDTICGFNIIEHLQRDDAKTLVRYAAVHLGKGSRFVISTPNGYSLKGMATRYNGFTHTLALTQMSAEELLAGGGFGKVVCFPWRPRRTLLAPIWEIEGQLIGTLFYSLGLIVREAIPYVNIEDMIAVGIK